MIQMKKKIAGIAFVLLSIAIMSVSAYVYESGTQTLQQTVKNIATLTLKSSILGDLEEGETRSYTYPTVPEFGSAISITTGKAGVVLKLDSDIQDLTETYSDYTLTVLYATVPGGSHSSGDTAATLTILAPDPPAITLDATGTWTFDFALTVTAKSVTSDSTAIATIYVTAEST